MKKHACYLTTMLALSGGAHAAITYVDATTGNTTLANGSTFTPTSYVTTGSPNSNTDNQWSTRTIFGNNGAVFTTNDSNANPGEDAPTLRTTISGLNAGESYEVFVYFWGSAATGNGQWDIQAGATVGSMSTYNNLNATSLGDGYVSDGTVYNTISFNNASPGVMVEEGNRDLFQASLGVLVADGSGFIQVFIDDNPGNDDRTWYDGVGYEIVPEPSSALLAGIGLLGLLRCRRA